MKNYRKSEQGFTLVELAIVMIIIGLLIGGVLKGQELIENAKTTAVIAEMKGFQAALNTFRDTYGGLPGDLANAATRLSGCNAGNANNCVGGNGNSLIVVNETFGSAVGNLNPIWASDVRGGTETFQAWKHLALADLITGVDPTLAIGQEASGATHPASSLRGGYNLYYDATVALVGGVVNGSGHLLRLTTQGITGPIGTNAAGQGVAPATPQQAANIDRKMDDGIANTGSIMASHGNPGAALGCWNGADGAYFEQTDQKSCTPFFLIDG